jgi:hypothetical protein
MNIVSNWDSQNLRGIILIIFEASKWFAQYTQNVNSRSETVTDTVGSGVVLTFARHCLHRRQEEWGSLTQCMIFIPTHDTEGSTVTFGGLNAWHEAFLHPLFQNWCISTNIFPLTQENEFNIGNYFERYIHKFSELSYFAKWSQKQHWSLPLIYPPTPKLRDCYIRSS